MGKQLGWTTIEQSKNLLKAGLDPNTADMYYSAYITYANGKPVKEPKYDLIAYPYKDRSSMVVGFTKVDYIPCWSLGALSELVPDEEPLFTKSEGTWTATIDIDEEHLSQFSEKTLVGTLYEAIKWLMENNFIKKG